MAYCCTSRLKEASSIFALEKSIFKDYFELRKGKAKNREKKKEKERKKKACEFQNFDITQNQLYQMGRLELTIGKKKKAKQEV